MRVLVVPHSAPAAERAEALFAGRPGVETAGGRRALAVLAARRPDLVYLVDVGSTTAAAAVTARALRIPVVVDTGDVVYELLRSTGRRSRAGLVVVRAAEQATLASAAHVVVRGAAHAELLAPKPTTFAPDLAPPDAHPVDGSSIREQLGLAGAFVVGLVGSLHRAPRLGITYGWDLVEALSHTDPRVAALVVGDGDGREELEARARALGVADRCRFVGRIPTAKVSQWIGAMDAAISTQTADLVGAVRTTGKLPLYLACGCPVLASDVGEAHRLLAPLGWTIPYHEVVDHGYPARLAARIDEWSADGAGARRREQAVAVHREHFDADEIRERVWQAVVSVAGAG